MSEFLDAALGYAARGWPVFPLRPRAKVPLFKNPHPEDDPLHGICKGECGNDGHGFNDATTDTERVTAWWSRCPDANIGVRTGIVTDVLDVDAQHDGLDTMAELLGGDDVELPCGAVVATPRGGLHLHFRPTGRGCAAGFRQGLDWRGKDGYVVVPPSVRPNGLRYFWWPGWDEGVTWPEPTLDELTIDTAPGWIVALLDRAAAPKPAQPARITPAASHGTAHSAAYGLAALEREALAVATAAEGGRNDALNRAAHALGRLVVDGTLNAATVEDVLLAAARDAGLGEREAASTIRSGLRARGAA